MNELLTDGQSEPTPVPGMPELYAYIQSITSASAPFFYLSASPYNLYPFLRSFRDAYYPHGPLILRDENWMTISGLLSNLTLGTEKYKVDRIRKIHGWFPRRKIILIGDSTQSDPEAYGECGLPRPMATWPTSRSCPNRRRRQVTSAECFQGGPDWSSYGRLPTSPRLESKRRTKRCGLKRHSLASLGQYPAWRPAQTTQEALC